MTLCSFENGSEQAITRVAKPWCPRAQAYAKAFLSLRPNALSDPGYDIGGIEAVLDALIAECVSITQGGLAGATSLERPTDE